MRCARAGRGWEILAPSNERPARTISTSAQQPGTPRETAPRKGLLTAGRKNGNHEPAPGVVRRDSPSGGRPGKHFQGHSMTNRSTTAQSTEAIRRWRSRAIVTLAATAGLTALK